MKVSEFIEWLKTQDQEATVEVVITKYGRGYDGGVEVRVADFTPEHAHYVDCRTFAKPDAPYYNDRTLLLGDEP